VGAVNYSVDADSVVLEWAQKLCDQQFRSMSELAEFLIQKQYVSSRSLHAFSVMTASAVKSNSTIGGLLPTGCVCSASASPFDFGTVLSHYSLHLTSLLIYVKPA